MSDLSERVEALRKYRAIVDRLDIVTSGSLPMLRVWDDVFLASDVLAALSEACKPEEWNRRALLAPREEEPGLRETLQRLYDYEMSEGTDEELLASMAQARKILSARPVEAKAEAGRSRPALKELKERIEKGYMTYGSIVAEIDLILKDIHRLQDDAPAPVEPSDELVARTLAKVETEWNRTHPEGTPVPADALRSAFHAGWAKCYELSGKVVFPETPWDEAAKYIATLLGTGEGT